ncbi:hypothetical protein CDD82_119 [Ophiocordyceps australis]|uniref:Zn(2)-C6 fungal-type domain-containing protein n=1 Tax=Ophiocordyceps australis TaxID=1399860 RepID=A0A2C5XT02_9HYPO|nr:hypothetical protein CDD82_119 [Ophiocordyceps australis]
MSDPSGMAPTADTNRPGPRTAPHADDEGDDGKSKKPVVKKRTKTGCLTCRKRRIKCDENKPRCRNCIKSKRECEGYNQRVVFKDPMNAEHNHFAPAIYAGGNPYIGDALTMAPKLSGPLPLQAIAPKPSPYDFNQPHMANLSASHHNTHHNQPQHMIHSDALANGDLSASLHSSMPNPLLDAAFAADQVHGAYNVNQNNYFAPRNLQDYAYGTSSSGIPITSSTEVANLGQPSTESAHVPDSDYDDPLSDDDVNMVSSDDENPSSRTLMAPSTAHLLWPATMNATRVRTFSAFAQERALSEYMDYAPHSDLRAHAMQVIFTHFVSVTGPSMSLYERDPSPHEEPGQFEGNAQLGHNLFSYTVPVLSLKHPGLLHAIMAIASLQIAKLQGTPATAALKHYHWSIRRIAKNVRTPLRRTKVSTLAATLLLAYFEVWSSDHMKWCSHLLGARLLFREIDLREMSRVCLPAKRLKWRSRGGFSRSTSDINYQLLSVITGTRVVAEDYGLQDGQSLDQHYLYVTDRDIEQYNTLRDLFWWYAKMDVYQSFLGGTRLFMEYEAWTQCLPRAPISNIHAIYGTYDHVILLLGRLASFTSRDQARKRKANRSSNTTAEGSPPQFPGIVPTHGRFRVPMGFSPPMGYSPHTDPNDEAGTPQSLEAAEQEWDSIRQGFEALESSLGPHFMPLNSEYMDRKETPFGSALHYRTYSVAGIWMNYYMGLIHLYRGRPNMPPAAMQAAQLAAPITARYAIKIGRIAAGLADDCSQLAEVSTTLAAAFIESCFCLFVAAVQLQNNDQRCWVTQRMYDISRLTGWQSAKKIAVGCEAAWQKACQLGHGPEYKRPDHLDDVPVSVWMLPRRRDASMSELSRNDGELNRSEERRLVHVRRLEQTNLAFGLLGVEADLDRIELADIN